MENNPTDTEETWLTFSRIYSGESNTIISVGGVFMDFLFIFGKVDGQLLSVELHPSFLPGTI